MYAIAVVVVVGPNGPSRVSKKILSAALWCQVWIVARILCYLKNYLHEQRKCLLSIYEYCVTSPP